jgi:hypothetical protein
LPSIGEDRLLTRAALWTVLPRMSSPCSLHKLPLEAVTIRRQFGDAFAKTTFDYENVLITL